VNDIREQFTEYESNARSRLPDSNCSDANRRVRKRSIQIRFFDGPSLDAVMDARSIFRVSTFLPIADSLKTELDRRGKAYTEIHERFGFLVDRNLQKDLTLSNELIRAQCQALAAIYKNDLVADELVSEVSQFRHYCHSHADSELVTVGAANQYSLLIADGVKSVFPNVEVARVLNNVVDSLLKSWLLSLNKVKSTVQ